MGFLFPEPKDPVLPPPPPTPPNFGTSSVSRAGQSQVDRSIGGFGSTILTSTQGDLTPANTARKSLLGQ